MKKDLNRLLRYAGSKLNYLEQINFIINKSNKTIFIEPFLGSGAVFLNLEKEFDSYYLNDLEYGIYTIFNTVANKENTYNEFIDFYNKVILKFGNIKKDKPAFYNFRNSFNKKLWKTNTKEEGFSIMLLYNSCINSMARWGPNGFNSSYGNRLYIPTEEVYNKIQNRLSKAIITNLDFFEFLEINNFNEERCLMFLDPPYIKREVSYKTISNKFYIKYIEFLKSTKTDIVYTDTNHNDLENFNKIILRTMRNISPNRKSENTLEEIILTNINI